MIQRKVVHHQGKTPSRTFAVESKFNTSNNKWASAFETWRGEQSDEYIAFACTSAAIWDTKEAATLAGQRALDVLQETDKFPNMCELW